MGLENPHHRGGWGCLQWGLHRKKHLVGPEVPVCSLHPWRSPHVRLAPKDGVWFQQITAARRGTSRRAASPIWWRAFDPNVWSGRALQENFHRVGGCAVLHQCIRPL